MEATQRRLPRRHRNTVNSEERSSNSNISGGIPTPLTAGDLDTELGLVWERSDNRLSRNNLETKTGAVTDGENASEGMTESDICPTAPLVEEIDRIIYDYRIEKDKVVEQHVVLESRKEFLKKRKDEERTSIIGLFSNILDILADREASLLCKLDEKYKSKENKLDELLLSLEDAHESIKTESNIAESIKAGDSHYKDMPLTDIKPLLSDIKTGNEEREVEIGELIRDSEVPVVELNNGIINVISGLNFARFPEAEDTADNETNETEGCVDIEQTEILEAEGGQDSDEETTEQRQEGELEGNFEELAGNSEELENSRLESNETETGAAGVDSTINDDQTDNVHPSPSAPPLTQAGEEEPPPPPYWQAIGLSGPEDTNLPRSPVTMVPRSPVTMVPMSPVAMVPSSVNPNSVPPFQETAPRPNVPQSNELVFFHNFLLKRQSDARAPKAVAMTWNFDLICVADRANSKVKIFTLPSGTYTEMYFGGCEIYDMAFIEVDYHSSEQRHVVTIPRAKTLMFISIGKDQPPKQVHKLKLIRGYTSIAKGPSGNTLVGADALPRGAEPVRVDIINIQGQILRSFKTASINTNFVYPKNVAVFKQAIVVVDWRLDIVSVLHEEGYNVAQYGGRPHYPLKDPNSLTLDHFGNVMVVDGKSGNIHVLDLQCQPLEIIKCPRGHSLKLAAFDTKSRRLAVVRQSGDVAIYDFKGGYKTNSYNEMLENMLQPQPMGQGFLPLVEGMLPTTIANIGSARQRQSNIVNRSNMFHL